MYSDVVLERCQLDHRGAEQRVAAEPAAATRQRVSATGAVRTHTTRYTTRYHTCYTSPHTGATCSNNSDPILVTYGIV